MRRKVNLFSSIDWFTVLLYLAMVFLGWVNIYSAVYNEEFDSIFNISQRYGKQLIWIIAAIVLAMIVILIDSQFYQLFAYIFYGLAILLLLLVLVFGAEVHGSKSWLAIGSFQLQPSEFAKLGTALALARYLTSHNVNLAKLPHLAISLIIMFTPAVLIMLQPDMGSTLVYASFFILLYREGLPNSLFFMAIAVVILFFLTLIFEKLMLLLIIFSFALIVFGFIEKSLKKSLVAALLFLGIAGFLKAVTFFVPALELTLYRIIFISLGASSVIYIILAFTQKIRSVFLVLTMLVSAVLFTYSVDYVFHNLLEPHQRTRINIMLGFETDPLGMGYNLNQSKIAIGSGGLSGKGFLQGTQTKFDFVPEQSTDFIFCTVGEEWGFLGTAFVVILFATLLLRLIFIAERQRSAFSRVYAYGVISILFFHFVINIGMTIGLVPVIGIPLPFFSYGGSSLWAFTILLFILVRLDASRMELLR